MHDIAFIRANPAAFDKGLERRSLPPLSEELIHLDQARRDALLALEALQAQRNQTSKTIGQLRAKGEDTAPLMAEMAENKARIPELEAAVQKAETELDSLIGVIPNLPALEVPDGSENITVRTFGAPHVIDQAKEHDALGEALGLMDFAAAAKISGARFVVLKGALARLERALGQFMLDLHTTEFGYQEHAVPYLVRDVALYGTGQLPRFADDLFHTKDDFWLIPTAEVSLTNLVREMILDEAKLPLRFTALTPCFRSEAGAAGRDTRGMIRQHQFHKVELVSITTPKQSAAEHERMTEAAEMVLQRLELHYRTMLLAALDMGFSAEKTYDIEVWLPGQQAYREISSCSNCGAFQARRMKARYRPVGEKATQFVHTLNGSGLAIGRALVAVMENYQLPDGSIEIPAVLRPYMAGETTIRAISK